MPRAARPAPLSIRLTPKERDDLANRAERAGLSLGGYFRAAALDAPVPKRHRADATELARLLAAVGHIGGNINQLAYVANTGGWPDSRAIAEAVAHIQWMRHHLTLALGMTPTGPAPPDPVA